MSSEMIGEPPAITEDSDLALIIRELYKGRVGRNQKTADFCVGGAMCHYFLRYQEGWNKKNFPFPDQLVINLMHIVEGWAGPSWVDRDIPVNELYDICDYYANAITNANDTGEYGDAWIHVDMFLKEFEID